MSVDLTLLIRHKNHTGSSTMLAIYETDELWDKIGCIEENFGVPVPEWFGAYVCRDDACEEVHYGNTQTTPYGDRLLEVPMGKLAALSSEPETKTIRNRAAWAFLEESDPDDWVALYWH